MTRAETVGLRKGETAIEFGLSPQRDNQPRVEARLYGSLRTERLRAALTQNPMTVTWRLQRRMPAEVYLEARAAVA